LAPIFRSKHDKFCVKCVSTGIIDTSEQEQIATALKCKKCKTKHKFRARHSDFCENHCMDATPSTTEEAVVVEEEPEEEDYEEEMMEEKPKKKKNKKKDKKKNKKKFATTFDDEEMDDDYEDEVEVVDEDEDAEVPDLEKFGFFGTLLKNIIVQNTWVDTPVA